jgi:hypothetical protein
VPLACRAAAEVFPWHEKSVRSYGAAPVRTTIPGSNSLKIVYNVSNGSAWLGFNLTGRDLSNTSGIGFWLKGDASNNVLNWQFANSSGNTYNASGSFNIRFNITFNEWRYVYLDWHYFELLNVTADELWNPRYIQINTDPGGSGSLTSNGTMYLDDWQLANIYQGIFCSPYRPTSSGYLNNEYLILSRTFRLRVATARATG